ncbi:MAG: alginate lyase family protein [Spirochaetales bacterium]|nr:alginate lyase family protein [Spirochaetales bacterium]
MEQAIVDFEKDRVIALAESCLEKEPICIGDCPAPLSKGGPNEYFSQSDYWWPNPDTEDNLPWVRHDGETNPDNFDDHRILVRRMRKVVCAEAAAYKLTGDEKYAQQAVKFLRAWFLTPKTRMEPTLNYSQVVLGRFDNGGRRGGIIDTLHFIELPLAILELKKSEAMDNETFEGLKAWFNDYIDFMMHSKLGKGEFDQVNNHGVAWVVQATLYAKLAGREDVTEICRNRFKEDFLVNQMAENGTFPEELARTKPYNYSLFIMDLLSILAYHLSTPEENLFEYKTESGKSMQTGLDFIIPVTKDKGSWPYHKDVEHFESYPTRQIYLLLTALNRDDKDLLDFWMSFDPEPTDIEVRRNLAMRQPVLWF